MSGKFHLMRHFAFITAVVICCFAAGLAFFLVAPSGFIQWGLDGQQQKQDHSVQPVVWSFMAIAVVLVPVFSSLFLLVKRAQDLIEQGARTIDDQRQTLAQSQRWVLLGRMVAGVAYQLNPPLAFSRSNVNMALQAVGDMAPVVRAASRVLDSATAGAASWPQSPDTEPGSPSSQLTRCSDEIHVAQDLLGDALMGLDQMSEFVGNLCRFTQLDRARTEAVDLNTLLRNAVAIARPMLSSQVKVIERWADLPLVACQVSQLTQAFLNVIVNAAQAIDTAGVITVSTSKDGQHICVCVHDSGCGIADNVLPRIFDPCFTTRPAGAGCGLGLAIARDIVTQHGGTISVRTQLGVGTTVQIELPVNQPSFR